MADEKQGHDIEKGSPELEEKRNNVSSENETKYEDHEDAGDEYSALLAYIDKEAQGRDDKSEHEQGEVQRKRIWYMPWKTREVRTTEQREVPDSWLQTEMIRGINDQEVNERRSEFGYNELESPRENMFLKFLSYFQGPILYVMEIAVLLAAGLRDWIDFGVIIGILMLNAFVGWYQEKQAGDIVSQLKASIAMKATIVRDGQEAEIEARELVPGDIVVVEEGVTIPADGRILASYDDKDRRKAKEIIDKAETSKKRGAGKGSGKGGGDAVPGEKADASPPSDQQPQDKTNGNTEQETGQEGDRKEGNHDEDDGDEDEGVDKGPSILSVDQSAITGESLAVDKYIGDTIYYTTGVKRGKCYIVVTAIAKQSFVGKTASLVTGSKGKGHFETVMTSIGSTLLALVILWVFIVWIGGFFRSVGIAEPAKNNLLVYTLIFLIIGVPVGLPCVTTTTMAVGAAYLAKQQAIVQKLSAIESLAGVDVLCSDKTGTLTANQLSLNEPFVPEGVDINWMMCVAALASSHNIKSLDPIDKITITGLKDFPKAREMLKQGWTTHKFTPFDPISKRITAEVEQNGKKFTCAKGAPNAILKLCSPSREDAESYKRKSGDFAGRGFRSLGVAVKEDNGDWQVLGLLPMFDPPRSDTAATIGEAQELGIRVKMLTGDAVAIAKETCRMLNLGTNVYDSQRLIGGRLAGSDISDFVEGADGFAEVFPEHKYQVVQMLQARGHLVAMTGDGVNDAPSLKMANCGIAVEGASDAARSAADVVFLDPGLNTIITSIKVARQIFHRMKAYIQYRIALCLHLEIYLTLSMIILNETISAELIVFLAIFADIATIAIAYDNAPYQRQPVEWQLPKIWVISVVLGALLALGTWIIRGTLFLSGGGVVQNFGSVQEILFLEVALTENWLIFLTRIGGGEWTWPSWQLVGAVLGLDILATIFALFGWMSGPAPHGGWTDIVTVVRIWAFSFGVIIVITMVYILLNRWTWLDNLGRKNRSKKNSAVEDMVHNLQRLTVVHEAGPEGEPDVYHFQHKREHGKEGIPRDAAKDDPNA